MHTYYKTAHKVPEHVASLLYDSADELHWFRLTPGTSNKFTYTEGDDVEMTVEYDFNDKLTVVVRNSEMEIPLCEVVRLYLQTDYSNARSPVYEHEIDIESDENEHVLDVLVGNRIVYLGVYIGESEVVQQSLHRYK
ncbi:hypothetical protein QKU48_gp1221 [Fadolivirus algeromassiliense]|jgi:hypothetical protein|uniref:Uncharacterized protein n=1 Tax=Fadolivirus FV1/VV64 TaxID=3070911 RepID=A0A7D3QWL3_9VIRU|nr:hypothetical protein QKU48_gp1221 [Fadolivirus algeromassiliense]QKF94679.1 hypothetical protein Fadolivirus_1_1221 [Fadolivirus FV1/VV64]